jgi:hypothetical protein
VGFQSFICFVDYYELHCMRNLRRHVAVLNRKVSYDNLLQRAELARQIAVCERTFIHTCNMQLELDILALCTESQGRFSISCQKGP